ncbi:oxidoreductase: short chain dehydrogenase/reductase family [Diplocarpon mali]|nr:oxidoreductase: short chain dehydrogenase/reductase family [Diplocarpon mali]
MATGIEIYFGPSTARYYIIDLRTESDVISSFSKIKHEFRPTRSEDFKNFTKINPLGTFWATKFTLPNRLAEAKGTILFTGATGSLRGSAGLSSFSPGKFGLRSQAQIMMPEYQAKGIHVAHLAIDGPVHGKLIWGWTRRK